MITTGLQCLNYFLLVPLGLEGSMHYFILQTQSPSYLQFSNAYFVAYGIFQQINTKRVEKCGKNQRGQSSTIFG